MKIYTVSLDKKAPIKEWESTGTETHGMVVVKAKKAKEAK